MIFPLITSDRERYYYIEYRHFNKKWVPLFRSKFTDEIIPFSTRESAENELNTILEQAKKSKLPVDKTRYRVTMDWTK